MCGIVGAVAERNIEDILLEGLKRLEYRGYDSAGIAILDPKTHEIQRHRVLGKVAKLEELLKEKPLVGRVGISHTRWATHGEPSTINAHPHISNNEVAVVHNGIIENHTELREKLIKMGYIFTSETDSEVVAHLIHHYLQEEDNMRRAIHLATNELEGAYALGVINKNHPQCLYGIRLGSPLVIGVGINEHFIASDSIALLPVTQRFIYLEEGDLVRLQVNSVEIYDKDFKLVEREIHETDARADATNKGNFRHYMQKEIFEQPDAIRDTLEGYIVNQHLIDQAFGPKTKDLFAKIKRIQIIACGTSYHAGLVAKYWIESIAKIPCRVEVASEYRYREGVVESDSLFVAISQSGETADTLAALRQAKKRGYAATLGICNTSHSALVREADLAFLTRAGIEVGVAASKTFTAQLAALLLLTISIARNHGLSKEDAQQYTKDLAQLPRLMSESLMLDKTIETLSAEFSDKFHALFLGRGIMYPIAMEGALKLKEISYVHAEAYPAGELKHGPLALIDKDMPVIIVAPRDALIEKLKSNISEVRARNGKVYIFCHESIHFNGDKDVTRIVMPDMPEHLLPLVYSIPLQLLAYHIAVRKGTDIDQPRNLAKSVTVE